MVKESAPLARRVADAKTPHALYDDATALKVFLRLRSGKERTLIKKRRFFQEPQEFVLQRLLFGIDVCKRHSRAGCERFKRGAEIIALYLLHKAKDVAPALELYIPPHHIHDGEPLLDLFNGSLHEGKRHRVLGSLNTRCLSFGVFSSKVLLLVFKRKI